jgi:hypothetical protein
MAGALLNALYVFLLPRISTSQAVGGARLTNSSLPTLRKVIFVANSTAVHS